MCVNLDNTLLITAKASLPMYSSNTALIIDLIWISNVKRKISWLRILKFKLNNVWTTLLKNKIVQLRFWKYNIIYLYIILKYYNNFRSNSWKWIWINLKNNYRFILK